MQNWDSFSEPHGGEPLLLGYKKLEFILEQFYGICDLSIQTNGTLITKEILDLLGKYNCSIGVSFDGLQSINDKFRVDQKGRGTFERIKRGIELILEHPIYSNDFSILSVIDPSSDPIEVYEYLSQYKPKMVDFLLKDGYYNHLPEGKKSLNSVEYGQWLTRLTKYYLSLGNPTVPIRKIDGLIEDYLRSKLNVNVMAPFGMIAINPNGDITKNELYDINPMGSSFTKKWNINKDPLLQLIESQEYKSYTLDLFTTAKECLSCEFLEHCNGGCYEVHTRWDQKNHLKNPTIYCADYQYFFKNIGSYCDKQLDHYLNLKNSVKDSIKTKNYISLESI